ncbi:MAG TPA: hypothetical protein VMX38_21485 [Verrucomicrobiae bacterium]|nr:hypothetical protein [Verrucomicrobiae bacterium]
MSTSIQLPAGDWSPRNLTLIFLLTLLAFFIMGYHPGLEDDAFYLAAIKRDLNPSLFPHDSAFFLIQFQATIFDKLIALSVRLTHIPLAWMALLWQFAAIFFILHSVWRIARHCFAGPSAYWAATVLIAVLLTLPVTGTGINLADQHLHPRSLATVLILAAIVEVIDRRLWVSAALLVFAFAIHAIMAAFGIVFCAFLTWSLKQSRQQTNAASSGLPSQPSSVFPLCPLWCKLFSTTKSAALFATVLFPLGWLFAPSSDAWRKAASTRSFYHLTNWAWYEWLGVFAPLVLIFILHRWLRRQSSSVETRLVLIHFVSALLYYGVLMTAVGLLIMLPPSLERLRPFEPMRYLHLLYLLFFLLAGALLGEYLLRQKFYRWALLFVPLTAGMLYSQIHMYPSTAHIEWPGEAAKNPWLQAFAWISRNTPVDALFALDPHYTQLPGEDYHGFRALAERSVLADLDKDAGMAARVPSLAPRWLREVTAEENWRNFTADDFRRLQKQFGVTWIVLSREDKLFADSHDQAAIMTCPYENQQVEVCRLY